MAKERLVAAATRMNFMVSDTEKPGGDRTEVSWVWVTYQDIEWVDEDGCELKWKDQGVLCLYISRTQLRHSFMFSLYLALWGA